MTCPVVANRLFSNDDHDRRVGRVLFTLGNDRLSNYCLCITLELNSSIACFVRRLDWTMCRQRLTTYIRSLATNHHHRHISSNMSTFVRMFSVFAVRSRSMLTGLNTYVFCRPSIGSVHVTVHMQQTMFLSTVTYEIRDRLALITLNRPDVLNAIDDTMPKDLSTCVNKANQDPSVHVIVLAGAGKAFCSGYDLSYYAQNSNQQAVQDMPWDSMKDYMFMKQNTDYFMSLFHSSKPTICQIHGHALAGGSDIALCCDIVIMANEAHIGYMPARVWGCPTTAMWIYR
jgi:hypothetical protein